MKNLIPYLLILSSKLQTIKLKIKINTIIYTHGILIACNALCGLSKMTYVLNVIKNFMDYKMKILPGVLDWKHQNH